MILRGVHFGEIELCGTPEVLIPMVSSGMSLGSALPDGWSQLVPRVRSWLASRFRDGMNLRLSSVPSFGPLLLSVGIFLSGLGGNNEDPVTGPERTGMGLISGVPHVGVDTRGVFSDPTLVVSFFSVVSCTGLVLSGTVAG